ncbi:ATP-binding protein [Haliscomenobacter sp.]|uniref:ATP-binding protein n=1 Tax=Haliscomenobacter sp. TaxID=2717303 RepID=UPI0033650FC1
MSKCYQLIGVPGSGKSTWIRNQIWALGLTIVSTDAFVEAYAEQQGQTYNKVFEDYMPQAVDLMAQQVVFAREHGHSVIWDQTSTTVASRRKKFHMLPDYEHVAVVFGTPEPAELARRLAGRPGKSIPDHVMLSMLQNLKEPTLEEGFQEIWHV